MSATLPFLFQPQTNVDWITYKTATAEIPDGPVLTNAGALLHYQKETDRFFCLINRSQPINDVYRSAIVHKVIARYKPNSLDVTLRFNYVNPEGKFSRRYVVPLLFHDVQKLTPIRPYPFTTQLLIAWDLDEQAIRSFDFQKATNIFSTFWGFADIGEVVQPFDRFFNRSTTDGTIETREKP